MNWDDFNPVKHAQKYRDDVYNVQDHLEEFSDDLDIASIWFHGDKILVGYSYTFPLLPEDDSKTLSHIVEAVVDNTSLVDAVLKEPHYFSAVSTFYNNARDKHVWGLMDTWQNLPIWKISVAEAQQFLADYFQLPATEFSDISTQYLQETTSYSLLDDVALYLVEFLGRTTHLSTDSSGRVTTYDCPQYDPISKTLDYSVLYAYTTDNRFTYTSAWDALLEISDYDFYLEDVTYLGTPADYQGILWFIGLKAVHKINLNEILFTDRLWQTGNQNISYREKFLFNFTIYGTPHQFIFSQALTDYSDFRSKLGVRNPMSPDENYLPVIPIVVGGELLDEEFNSPSSPTLQKDTEALAKALKIEHSLLRTAVTELEQQKPKELMGAYLFFGANLFSPHKHELEYVTRFLQQIHKEFMDNTLHYQHFMNWNYVLEITQGTLLDDEAAQDSAFRHYFNIKKMTITEEVTAFPTDYKDIPELADLKKQDELVRLHYKSWFEPKVWSAVEGVYKPLDYKIQYLNFISDVYAVAIIYPVTELGNVLSPEYILCEKRGKTWIKYVITNPVLMIQTGNNDVQRLDPITLTDIIFRGDSQFRIPMRKDILQQFSTDKRNKIINSTMAINIIARKAQYINWYATEEFNTFIQVVSIIFTIWRGIVMGIWAAIRGILIAIIAAKVGAWIAKKVGGDLGVALGFISSMAILYYGGAFSSTGTNANIVQVTVQNIQLATSSLSSIHNVKIQEKMEELQRKMLLFDKNTKEFMEELEDAKEDLLAGSGIKYELSQLMKELDTAIESPADFLYRTTQIKNPGVLLLQGPTTHISRQLQLPNYLTQTNIAT